MGPKILPGHSVSMHDVEVVLSPEQMFPPFEAFVKIDRLRAFEPIPQVELHFDQSDHWLQRQSTRAKHKWI